MSSMKFYAAPIIGFFLFALIQLSYGQSLAPSPAAEGPSSDAGTAIDQGIAYLLLMLALAVTYLVH
ncbi:unnamed protein product [Linum tenue]|uniref:Uncharacterized protein n=1 Tax=Linum tenue TaxID=586396 RepID=A0AAV0QCB8_9ROSI|nr:unnamed protein product [Linum tenue]CAI0628942.1 unnamed protein product [Linum tenue]